MMDIKFIRDNLELMKQTAQNKNLVLDFDRLIILDDERRELQRSIEDLKSAKNKVSKEIGKLTPEQRASALAEMKKVDAEQENLQKKLVPIVDEYQNLMFQVPMITDPRTPIGHDDSGNKEIFKWGDMPAFQFEPKNHEELGRDLDIIDFERGAKIGGSRSYVLKGDGTRLQWSLIKYAMDFLSRRGYVLMDVPVLVGKESLFGTGYFPGAEEEIYQLPKDEKYLVGTSEVSLGYFYANEILEEKQLPIKFCGVSACFRREAGSYGKDTHGLYRVHQFFKVEQFIICKNDDDESRKMHDELMKNSEEFLQSLQLPYRILNICTGDMGRGKYYMNDIETWMPGRNAYGETHSCSTLHDFQSRRLNLRYRDADGKVQYCHTLNNTVVATPRILIPLMELNQNKDGSINIPEVLKPYFDNQNKITPRNNYVRH